MEETGHDECAGAYRLPKIIIWSAVDLINLCILSIDAVLYIS